MHIFMNWIFILIVIASSHWGLSLEKRVQSATTRMLVERDSVYYVRLQARQSQFEF